MLHPISRFVPYGVFLSVRDVLGFRRDAREKRTVGNVARFPPNASKHLIHAEALERLHGCDFELAPQRAALAVGRAGFGVGGGARTRGRVEKRRESSRSVRGQIVGNF